MNAASYVDAVLRAEPSATLAKVTVILTVTCVSAAALRRAPAAVRHVVWLAGLVSAASMMLLAPIAPGIAVPVARGATVDGGTAGRVDPPRTGNVSREVVAAPTSFHTRTPTPSADTPRGASRDVMRAFSSLATPAGLLALWAIGAAVVLSRALVGHVIVARLVCGARRVNDIDLGAAAARFDAGHVRLLASDRIATPITTRWHRPVVVLPESAAQWSDERRRIVFVHELAHIVRGDYAAQAVATLAAAALWFHPLAWLALARLKAEAEHAADDVVLSSGTPGVAYASHLLELARAAAPMRLSAAVSVGVVRSSRVERRFEAILDERRSRRGLGWRAIGAAALSSAVILSPLAGVRTVARAMTPRVFQTPPAPPPTQPTPIGRAAPPIRVLDVPRSAIPGATEPDSTVERSIAAVSGARLNLNLPTGGGVSVHGWDSPRIRVRAALGGEDWRDVRIDLTRDGRDAGLSSTFASGGTHNTELTFQIWVPLETGIQLSSAGGSVTIDHVRGDLRGRTGGGNIEIRNGRGMAELTTGGGEITVLDSRLDGTVSTGWGRVRIENNSGDLRGLTTGPSVDRYTSRPPSDPGGNRRDDVSTINTNLGCVSVSVGDRPTKGNFSISKNGGSIYLPLAPAGWALSTGGGRIVVDSTAGSIVAVTGGGDIDLKAASGDATVSTGAGDVSVRVVGAGDAAHNIDVCNGYGRVTLDLPRDLDATIELETAYTDNAQHKTTIDSDFDLSRSETPAWDDRFGTPRKFVRAVGKVGVGTSVIRVSTVNGDIAVHRR